MADEAAVRLFCGADLEGDGDLLAEWFGERDVGVGVLVAGDPGGVLVLEDLGDRARLDATVAGDGGAGAGADVTGVVGRHVGGVEHGAVRSWARTAASARPGEQGPARDRVPTTADRCALISAATRSFLTAVDD